LVALTVEQKAAWKGMSTVERSADAKVCHWVESMVVAMVGLLVFGSVGMWAS
jgi:hypothetical protein